MELESKYVTYNNDGESTCGDDRETSEERYHENYSGPCRTVAVTLYVPPVADPTEVKVTVPEEKAGPATGEPEDLSEDDEDDLIDQHNRDIDPAKEGGA